MFSQVKRSNILMGVYTHAKKEGRPQHCIKQLCNDPPILHNSPIQCTLTAQRYVDEVLHRHILFETIFSSRKTMPDTISTIWQGTVCKSVMSTP